MTHKTTSAENKVHSATNFLEHVQRLIPLIAGAADPAERDHQLPENLLDALHQNSLFRLLLPKPFGGYELDPASFCKIIEAVAKIDASTSWCLCQAGPEHQPVDTTDCFPPEPWQRPRTGCTAVPVRRSGNKTD